MKMIWRKILSKLFLSDDEYYVYIIEETGRERFAARSIKNVHYRGEYKTMYSITQREAYLKGKINLKGLLL